MQQKPPVVINDHPEIHQGGDGPPLVLLHGLGGSWHIWKPVIARLEEKFHVVALTVPGHPGGEALADTQGVSVARLADQLLVQLRGLGFESAHVAGNSLGGWLAVELARRGFARSLTLLSPAGAWTTEKDFRSLVRSLLIPYFLMPVMRVIAWLFGGLAGVRRTLGASLMEHGERLSRTTLLDMLRRFSHTRMMRPLFANAHRSGPIEPLPAPGIPVHIAWGGKDKVLPFDRYGAPFVARIGGAGFIKLENAGHVPMYDAPDEVAGIIAATCDQCRTETVARSA
ncbi:MAG TPA: alpha/beta hydrolase [Nevskiaceae bacterium]|nr:alpha/beta hydrolase [Nevskiaceae bacterium]